MTGTKGSTTRTATACCGGKDCQPVDFCLLPGNAPGLDIPAIGCVGINWSKVLQIGSPDGRAHVCMGVALSSPGHGHDEPAQRFQRCVILPGEV